MPRYRIRPAADEDVSFLADVVITATRAQGRLPGHFDERQWRQSFGERTTKHIHGESPDSATSVVEVGPERAGRVWITRTADHIELNGLQLLPGFQRRGIATAIIETLKSQAAAAGIPLDLDVEKDNPDARKLYERLGFVQVGETEQECRLRWSPQAATDPAPAPSAAE